MCIAHKEILQIATKKVRGEKMVMKKWLSCSENNYQGIRQSMIYDPFNNQKSLPEKMLIGIGSRLPFVLGR